MDFFNPEKFDKYVVSILASAWVAALIAVLLAPKNPAMLASKDIRPRWFSDNPAKHFTETSFLIAAPLWMAQMVVIVATQAYEGFGPWHYLGVCVGIVLPTIICPLIRRAPTEEAALHLWDRHWVRSHLWLGLLVYVGSYFWTHYFDCLLGAYYTFKAHTLNNVPIAMYLAAHSYFCFYHSMTNMALRRWYTSHTYAALPKGMATLGTVVLVCAMAWTTAFMEAFTIQGFPYYHIEDYTHMYTTGSIVYGIYFVVSFPMYYRLDEGGVWSMAQTAIDSLGGCMLVTILLDLWRLAITTVKNTDGPGLAWAGNARVQ